MITRTNLTAAPSILGKECIGVLYFDGDGYVVATDVWAVPRDVTADDLHAELERLGGWPPRAVKAFFIFRGDGRSLAFTRQQSPIIIGGRA